MTVVEDNGVNAPGQRPVSRAVSISPMEALERSRVDVIGMIRDGIPAREYLPGIEGLLPRAKRVHIAAAAKSGKSISLAVVTALDIVAAGGTVVVLDRENGTDEYARRLGAVLEARGADDASREIVSERLLYHAWSVLSLSWGADPAYAAAFEGADVVIFDSTRSHTAPLCLAEDASDDWAAFTSAFIDPLMRAGIGTVLIDNTGHESKGRPRGTSAKTDLCDLAFTAETVKPFGLTVAGIVELRCIASRIGEITVGDTWRMELGDGHYGSWKPGAPTERPDKGIRAALTSAATMEKVSRAVEQKEGLSKREIRGAVTGNNAEIEKALAQLVSEGYIDADRESRAHSYRSIRPYRESADGPTVPNVPRPCPDRAQGADERTVPPCPTLKGGTGTGTVSGREHHGNRAPTVFGELAGDSSLLPDSGTTASSAAEARPLRSDPASGDECGGRSVEECEALALTLEHQAAEHGGAG